MPQFKACHLWTERQVTHSRPHSPGGAVGAVGALGPFLFMLLPEGAGALASRALLEAVMPPPYVMETLPPFVAAEYHARRALEKAAAHLSGLFTPCRGASRGHRAVGYSTPEFLKAQARG